MATRDEARRRPLKRGWGRMAITSAALILLLAPPGAAGQAGEATSAETIVRTFRILAVDAAGARYFKTPALKAALASDPGFADLGLVMVDDPAGADAILEVSYKFAWDYPFSLRDRATGVVLVHGTGSGPFSGPAGAVSVAHELVELLRPYRQLPAGAAGGEGLTALVSGLVTTGDIVRITRWQGMNTRGTVASVTECTLEVRVGTDLESVSLWDIRTLKRQVMSPPDHPVAAFFYGAAAACNDIGCLPGALVVVGIGGLVEVFEDMASPPQLVLYRSAQWRAPPQKCQATLG